MVAFKQHNLALHLTFSSSVRAHLDLNRQPFLPGSSFYEQARIPTHPPSPLLAQHPLKIKSQNLVKAI